MIVCNGRDAISKTIREESDRCRIATEVALLSVIALSIIGFETARSMRTKEELLRKEWQQMKVVLRKIIHAAKQVIGMLLGIFVARKV